ncbi:lipoprotein [Neobacillus drentensis]
MKKIITAILSLLLLSGCSNATSCPKFNKRLLN